MKKAKTMAMNETTDIKIQTPPSKAPAKKAHVSLVKPAETGPRGPGIGCRPTGDQ